MEFRILRRENNFVKGTINKVRGQIAAMRVRIPTSIQKITQGRTEVWASGNNIKELIEDLDKQYHGTKEKIYDEQGKTYKFINIYVNKEDIRLLQQGHTPLTEKDEVDIVVAIPGG